MFRPLLAAMLLPMSIACAFGQRATTHNARASVSFVQDRKRLPDPGWQAELRSRPAWKGFLSTHPGWVVEFNEETALPRRAFGPGIPASGADAVEQARSFIQHELASFAVPMEELVPRPVFSTSKHRFVHFGQSHAGKEVLFSDVLVKLDAQGRVICFGLEVQNIGGTPDAPVISDDAARASAAAGLEDVLSSDVSEALAWLAVPSFRSMEHHLVHQVVVRTGGHAAPGRWRCLVDAMDGRLLYRKNEVMTENAVADDSGADVTLTGTISVSPVLATQVQGMRNLHMTIDGQQFVTDPNGFIASGHAGPVNYSAPLSGDWSVVQTAGVTPTLSGQLLEGANAVTFDNEATLQERSAYYHVNNIHDHMKDVLPSFTGMDIPLPTNVDLLTDNCNAFYDGASINFYAEANDCYSMARIADVPYHEYGHGINHTFYAAAGNTYNNGAMDEGYADVWAISLTLDPVLALGYTISNPQSYIRRYDINKKVYPVDITGEPHSDGEIIAGAWWDTYLQLGNDMTYTMALFADAYAGYQAIAADGEEGEAYRSVLIDVLQADDDDGNLLNGTPHGAAITEAFRIHGITLLAGFDIAHIPLETAPISTPITITASTTIDGVFAQYLQGVQLNYRVNTGPWQQMIMTNVGEDNYEAQIPGQPAGTVIAYYIGLLDIGNVLSSETPVGAAQPDPNLPYFMLVGFDLQRTEDADSHNELGNWNFGMPGDNASTGIWDLFAPNPTFSTVDGSIIQTDQQHTPGGEFCFFTGNGADPNTPGENDVDDGRTTLQSSPIDLSAYVVPTFTLWRWYTNSPPGGANPGQDWWYVQISPDGNNWFFVENTRTDERDWRRLAFRVQDYFPPTSTFSIRFIASDSTHIGQNLDGGSLVEAAVDDIQLWDQQDVGIVDLHDAGSMVLFPSPANNEIQLLAQHVSNGPVTVLITDAAGRSLRTEHVIAANAIINARFDLHDLAPGSYVLRLRWNGGGTSKPFSIVR